MTFTFTLDCFPDYTKFDKTHKVFCAMQIIGDENIHPDEADGTEGELVNLDPDFTSVTAGTKGADGKPWDKLEFDGDAAKVNFNSLGNNLKASQDRANVDFFGNLNRVANWKAFSSDPDVLTGYYFPMQLVAEDGAKLNRVQKDGKVKTLVFGQTDDGEGKINLIQAVNPDSPVVDCELESKDGSKKTHFTFDFSKVVFK